MSKLKEHGWKPGNMQWDVLTGHKTFDRQFTCPTIGSRLGGGQMSCGIRPTSETVGPVGQIKPPGYFWDYDIDWMFDRAPEQVRAYLRKAADIEAVIAYEFHHYTPTFRESQWSRQRYRTGDQHKVVHGYVVTRAADYRLLRVFYVGPNYKSRQVIDTILPYIAIDHAEARRA